MNKKILFLLICMLVLFGCNYSKELRVTPTAIPSVQRLLDSTVLIETSTGSGTGVTIIKNDQIFVLTAAHLFIEEIRIDIPPTVDVPPILSLVQIPIIKKIINTEDVFVRKYITYNENQKVFIRKPAKVLLLDEELDIAILRLEEADTKNFLCQSVKFYKKRVAVGTEVYHVGNFFGSHYENSVSSGIISSNDRFLNTMYQTDATGNHGSSGGGLFKKESGEYIGMFVLIGKGNGLYFVTPEDVIEKWADKKGFHYLFE